MNIDTLAQGLYDDSNGLLARIQCEGGRGLSFNLDCDDWNGAEKRRHFIVTCNGVLESDLCLGPANAISVHAEHPLLLDRLGKQGALYFSTRARDALQLYSDIWDIVSEHYLQWRCPSEVIGRSPSSFRSLVEGGYGLLLRGPLRLLAHVQARIGNVLTTQLIETHTGQGTVVALIVEDRFVICEGVEVVEHAA